MFLLDVHSARRRDAERLVEAVERGGPKVRRRLRAVLGTQPPGHVLEPIDLLSTGTTALEVALDAIGLLDRTRIEDVDAEQLIDLRTVHVAHCRRSKICGLRRSASRPMPSVIRALAVTSGMPTRVATARYVRPSR